jgi:CHAT domain-containing protein
MADEGISISAMLLTGAARSVVATLWPVDGLSTSLLMLRFYWEWRVRGEHPALALARAQAWLQSSSDADKLRFASETVIADGVLGGAAAERMHAELADLFAAIGPDSYSHPYYWAGFYYSG